MKTSDISATTVSDWPTPTVSISTTSKPAASHRVTASRVRRATPPRCVWLGDGRMKASRSRDKRSIRVLSPKIDPPEREEDGSIASTATLSPRPISIMPKLSIKVDFPTPGVPDNPIRSASRPLGSAASSSVACAR